MITKTLQFHHRPAEKHCPRKCRFLLQLRFTKDSQHFPSSMMHDRQRLEAQNDKTEQRGGVLFDHPVVIYRKSCSRINCIHVSACSRKKRKESHFRRFSNLCGFYHFILKASMILKLAK